MHFHHLGAAGGSITVQGISPFISPTTFYSKNKGETRETGPLVILVFYFDATGIITSELDRGLGPPTQRLLNVKENGPGCVSPAFEGKAFPGSFPGFSDCRKPRDWAVSLGSTVLLAGSL